jgi:hypothetical protein
MRCPPTVTDTQALEAVVALEQAERAELLAELEERKR